MLEDARFALTRFNECRDEQERRVLWFALIGLLRAVGHVLDKVDAAADAGLRRRLDVRWPAARETPIFRDFVEKDRNQFLKTYQPMPRRAVITSRDGKVLMSRGGAPLITSGLYVMEGPFQGRGAVDVAGEAVAWWERELAALTCVAGTGSSTAG